MGYTRVGVLPEEIGRLWGLPINPKSARVEMRNSDICCPFLIFLFHLPPAQTHITFFFYQPRCYVFFLTGPAFLFFFFCFRFGNKLGSSALSIGSFFDGAWEGVKAEERRGGYADGDPYRGRETEVIDRAGLLTLSLYWSFRTPYNTAYLVYPPMFPTGPLALGRWTLGSSNARVAFFCF